MNAADKMKLLTISDCSIFTSSPASASLLIGACKLLEKIFAFLRCPNSSHIDCVHTIRALDTLKDNILKLSKLSSIDIYFLTTS